MFFIQLCLIAKQSRIIEKKKNLPIYLLRKQPMSYQSPIEPQSRPRCLPESIAIYGPHLILSRNMLTFFSSRSVVLIVKPRRAARTPRTPIVSVLGLLRYPYLKSSISMGILHGPAQLKLLVSMIEVLPPGVQSLSIARQSETLLTIFIILICEYKVVTVQCSQQVALGVSSLPKIYYNIINWMQDHSEEENLINEIQTIVYPSYPLGCSAQDFLTHYEALFDALRRFDRSTDLSGLHRPPHGLKEADKDEKPAKEEEITEHIVMSIINLLNKSCSHCHRKEYSQSIFALLGEFRGHLKDLAIGKQQLRISYWVQHLDIQNPTALYYSIKEPELLAHYDKLYQLLHYIPHRETFLLNYTAVILAQEKFEAALKGAQTSLPIQYQYYLAVIASATYGCKYLWSRAVGAFLRVGGDLAWIVEGSSAAPAIMQEMGRYSALIAYNFKQLAKEDLFGSNSSQGQQRLISLLWLCYYQALACLDLVFGLIPERFDFFKYLPDLPTVHPTIWSFEAVRKTEGMESLHEIRVAEEFASLYSWENDEQEEIIKIEGARSIELPIHTNQMPKRVQSLPDLRNTQIYRLGRAQEEEIFEKISNLQSLRYLKSVFHKYVHFGPLANNYTSNHGSKLEDNMVLASEWDFEIKGLNRIELVLGSKVRQGLQGLVGAMRVENNDKSKQLKHYYQFFNNYMYEYESYTKLMKELSINQKNYLKLVTKSPFLFTQQAFQRMKHDLGKLGLDSLDFVMEAVSFKLELSINLLSFIFDRAAQELQ